MTKEVIRPRDRDALIQSLRAGVVPRMGQHLIQVGRARELDALVKDLERVADGGSSFRLILGEYGAGKTFFLNLTRAIALEKKFVTVHADLNPDRRLHASSGQARSLYMELVKNMATRVKPEGALQSVVERFVAQAKTEAAEKGLSSTEVIHQKLDKLKELVNGYDFAHVIAEYCRGVEEDNEDLRGNAIRWLRGEYSTKTDAREALGVRSIVDDANVYDQLKLLGMFVQLAGYSGLLVCLDEMVNLYKLANTQARNANYEQILRILNDALQGSACGLAFILGGTPEFLLDPRKGLHSYQALQYRLSENSFAKDGRVDFTNPVLRLSSLTPSEFFVLLHKIQHVYAGGNEENYLLSEEALQSFMAYCSKKLGDSYFKTPRTTITSFVNLLAVLEQNPETQWTDLIESVAFVADAAPESVEEEDFVEFKF